MVSAVRKLVLFEYEPEPLRDARPDGDEERFIDDLEVEQLLLSASQRIRVEQELAVGSDPDAGIGDPEGLEAARGLMAGFALVLPIWALIVLALSLL